MPKKMDNGKCNYAARCTSNQEMMTIDLKRKRSVQIGLMLVILVGVTVLIKGCATQPSARVSRISLPQYHGMTKAEVIQKLGNPLHDEKFAMSETFGELTITLQNHYPLSKPENHRVQIEQLTWYKDEYWTALWLHEVNGKWIVLDSCRWHKDILF